MDWSPFVIWSLFNLFKGFCIQKFTFLCIFFLCKNWCNMCIKTLYVLSVYSVTKWFFFLSFGCINKSCCEVALILLIISFACDGSFWCKVSTFPSLFLFSETGSVLPPRLACSTVCGPGCSWSCKSFASASHIPPGSLYTHLSFVFMRHNFTMYLWLAWNTLYSSSWPLTQGCLVLQSLPAKERDYRHRSSNLAPPFFKCVVFSCLF